MRASSSDLVASLLDELDDGIWVLDAHRGVVLDANDTAVGTLGHQRTELLGTEFGELFVPPLSQDAWRLLVAQVPPEGIHRLGIRLQHRDARIVSADLTLTRRVADTGTGSGDDVVVAAVIVSDHGEDRLARTISAIGRGTAVVDRNGRIEYANDAFARLLSLSREQLIGHSVFDPPWQLHDADGAAARSDRSPAVLALRNGTPVREQGYSHRTGRNDEQRWLTMDADPVRDHNGKVDAVALTLSDATRQHAAEAQLDELRRTDALTGVASRNEITAQLVTAVEDARRLDGRRVGVLHVDLDAFRSINDTFGATVGDTVLRTICDRFKDLGDRHVALGRIGVDELLVVVAGDGPSVAFDARLRRLAEEIQRRTEQLLTIDGLDLRTTASIGVARWPGDGDDAGGLQRAADRALTAGRRDGRHQLRFYERSLDERTRTGLALDRDLRRAAAQRELEVHYQPIVDLRSGRVAAAEALVRWHHPEHGPIPPSVFIPTAEATGAISAVSDLVMTTVAQNLAEWNAAGLLPEGARIAVNISAAEFAQRGFVERLSGTLDNAGVSPSQIELEITETLLMQDLDTTATRLSSLDELGFLVALDDFGTGYSSLSYLHSLPLHTLKVDRCFVGDLRDGRSETITRAILSLAHGLGIIAVGEGVETDEQRRFLIDAGCDLVQGFFYAPPLPRAAFEAFLADQDTAQQDTAQQDTAQQDTAQQERADSPTERIDLQHS